MSKGQFKLVHDLDDLQQGQDQIGVLDDFNILDGEKYENIDAIVIPSLIENDKRNHRIFMNENQNILSRAETAHLAEKFLDKDEKKLLPHYDQIKFEKQGVYLDDQGEYNRQSENRIASIKEKLKSTKDKNIYSLGIENVIARDFKSTPSSSTQNTYRDLEDNSQKANTSAFAKKQFQTDQKDMQKKGQAILDFLEENADDQANQGENYGSHADNKTNNKEQFINDINQKVKGSEKYDTALQKAENDALLVQRKIQINWDQNQDDRGLLEQSIEKHRQIQANEQKDEEYRKTHPQEEQVNEILKVAIQFEQRTTENLSREIEIIQAPLPQKSAFSANSNNAGKNEKIQEIKELSSSSYEALKTIQTDEDMKNSQQLIYNQTSLSVQDVKHGTASILNVSLPSERMIGRSILDKRISGSTQYSGKEGENVQKSDEKEITQEEMIQMKDELDFIYENDTSPGLAGVLQRLRQKGMLTDNNYDYVGRNQDEKPHNTLLGKDQQGIVLDYRDETGKLMTQQQAFRYMCWKFHGQPKGKGKLEKERQKELQREKIKSIVPGETVLLKALQMSGSDHLVIGQR